MTTIAKALVAFLTALGTWGATAFADNGLTAVEAFGLCGVLVAALTVWAVPNAPSPKEGGHSALYYLGVIALVLTLIVLCSLIFGDGNLTIGGDGA